MKKIKIIKGDCLQEMQKLIDEGVKVDAIITDPPYKTTSRGNPGNTGGMYKKELVLKGDTFKYNDCHVGKWMPLLYSLLKDGGHCYVMTNNKNLKEFLNIGSDCGFHFVKSLIWNKCSKIMGHSYMGQYEYVLFFRKGSWKKINNCGTSDIITIPYKKTKDAQGNNIHDNEKPIELMSVLIGNSSEGDDLVLDPFMGSGSTGIACADLGRKFIGIELDDKYFEIARNRFEGKFIRINN